MCNAMHYYSTFQRLVRCTCGIESYATSTLSICVAAAASTSIKKLPRPTYNRCASPFLFLTPNACITCPKYFTTYFTTSSSSHPPRPTTRSRKLAGAFFIFPCLYAILLYIGGKTAARPLIFEDFSIADTT